MKRSALADVFSGVDVVRFSDENRPERKGLRNGFGVGRQILQSLSQTVAASLLSVESTDNVWMSAEHQHDEEAVLSNPDALRVGCGAQPESPKFKSLENVKLPGLGKWKLSLYNAEKFHAGNIAILQRGAHVVAIDSGCLRNYRFIRKRIKSKKNSSFFLINTHAHPDHTGGNAKMARNGAVVVSRHSARNQMIDNFPIRKQLGLPVVTFEDQMELYAGGQEINLISLPAGHTSADLAVWIPGLNILHTGDVYMREDYPLIDLSTNGSIAGLIESVSMMLSHINKDTTVIPGHGGLAGRKQLIQYRRMLRDVSAAVEIHKGKGLDVEEVKNLDLTKKYDQQWGNGHLISGRQFVERVFRSLPMPLPENNKPLARDRSQIALEPGTLPPIELRAARANSRINRRGQFVLSLEANDATLVQSSDSGADPLTGPLAVQALVDDYAKFIADQRPNASIQYCESDDGKNLNIGKLDPVVDSVRVRKDHLAIKMNLMALDHLNERDQQLSQSRESWENVHVLIHGGVAQSEQLPLV